jgi:hypothetical protein
MGARPLETTSPDRVMLVEIDKHIRAKSILDAARYAWRAAMRRAKKLDYVLAVRKGVIVGALVPTEWLPATPPNFPGFPDTKPRRIGFRGYEAPAEVQERYCNKPAPIKKRGDQSSFHYRGGG